MARSRGTRLAVATAIAAIAASAGMLAAPAAPAQAHDQLVSSSPADGAALTAQPTMVELVYTEEIVELGVIVEVIDSSGTDWVDGTPSAAGTVVTVPLRDGMGGDSYALRWRVVSSDGHPIDGASTFSLTLETPAPTTFPSPAPEDTTSSQPNAAEPAPSASGAPAAADDRVPPLSTTLAVGGGVMVLAVLGAIIGRYVSRRRLQQERLRDGA